MTAPNCPQATSPRVAAIIPAFKQPGLLGEAILSVLRQDEEARAVAVVVNDGCPMPETQEVAVSFSRAFPGRVFVVRRPNGGLSAARNTGVDFALAAWPQLEAVMFLDADNRIERSFLSRALAALAAAPEEIGWVYPDVDMFGVAESWATGGEFSFLALLDSNYCEAGSVVRRSVLARGVRFDDTMRHGFEDWDFWLQVAEAGFRGQHLPNVGFQYRRRGESMLSAAERRREWITVEMNKKRRALLNPRNLRLIEARERPRFALFHPDEPMAYYTSDPAVENRSIPIEEAVRKLRLFQASPASINMPPFLCFASRPSLSRLSDALVLTTVFWLVQVLMREKRSARVFLTSEPGVEARFRVDDPSCADRPAGEAALIVLSPADPLLAEDELSYVAARFDTGGANNVATIVIELPESPEQSDEPADSGAMRALDRFLAELALQPPEAPGWRQDSRPPRHDLTGVYERVCDVGILAPLTPDLNSRGEIGFLIPIHSFGGVEKVVANQARVLRQLGFRTHLFISGEASFLLTAETREAFATVNLLLSPGFDRADLRATYFGAITSALERKGDTRIRRDALGLLCGMDVVINTHSVGCHGIAARLRELGVCMMLALHLVDHDKFGAPIGNPHMALAYEHAYDHFLVISKNLRDWCFAHGVPEQKILLLPNAPSYPQRDTPETVRSIRATRAPGPLNVLFLGRLDPQKGLDRLAKIIAATKEGPFVWRVIGKAVRADPRSESVDLGVAVEPPLHDPAALDAAYDWADALVLPSRFEGAPLTILEARRRGVVVLATNVGAVAETLPDGGFLFDPGQDEATIVAEFIDRLTLLARDPERLRAEALAALRAPPMTWEQSIEPLVEAIEGGGKTPTTPFASSQSYLDSFAGPPTTNTPAR